MNRRKSKIIAFIIAPAILLLVFYMVLMGILGENNKILGLSENFIQLLLENNYGEAFSLLSLDYQREFFTQPLIFSYSFDSVKSSQNAFWGTETDISGKKALSDSTLSDFIDLKTKKKKVGYVKKEFAFLPWRRGNCLETSFAVPQKTPNRFKFYLLKLFKGFPEDLATQFNENKIILQKDGSFWMISDIILNNQRVENIFLEEDYDIILDSNRADLYTLEELGKIANYLEQNKVRERNLEAFYEVIGVKGSKVKNYIEMIGNRKVIEKDEF